MTEMQTTLSTATSSGTLTHLFDVGITSTPSGTLQLDSAALNNALNSKFSDVANLFNSATGYATRFEAFATAALDVQGAFANRTANFNGSIKSLDTQISNIEARLKRVEERYRMQFSALNTAMLRMNQTSSYLSQQLAKL
jgi:flagellar hook-associated protein 2